MPVGRSNGRTYLHNNITPSLFHYQHIRTAQGIQSRSIFEEDQREKEKKTFRAFWARLTREFSSVSETLVILTILALCSYGIILFLKTKVKIINMLQRGDLTGVLQMADRLNRVEHRDPLLNDLITTVKTRLDQLEEEEEDCDNNNDNHESDSEDLDDDEEEDENDEADSEDDTADSTSDSGVWVSD